MKTESSKKKKSQKKAFMRSLSEKLVALALSFCYLSTFVYELEAIPVGAAGLVRVQASVPIVDIASPSSDGVSVNQYSSYDVPTQGLVLNNNFRTSAGLSTQSIRDASGNLMHIARNAKTSAIDASLIVNEVLSGGARSSLLGHTEIVGQRAGFILVNPSGISCEGCGFINTAGVTLSTSSRSLAGTTLALRHEVQEGDILFTGEGLSHLDNAQEINIIARSLRIDSSNSAANLSDWVVYLGNNALDQVYDTTTGRSTITQDTSVTLSPRGEAKSRYALDLASLGAIRSRSIFLVSTEQGLGVRIAGELIASAGDMALSFDASDPSADYTIEETGRLEVTDSAFGLSVTLSNANSSSVFKNNGLLLSQGSLLINTGKAMLHNLGSDQNRSNPFSFSCTAGGGHTITGSYTAAIYACGNATLYSADIKNESSYSQKLSAKSSRNALIGTGAGVLSIARNASNAPTKFINASGRVETRSGNANFSVKNFRNTKAKFELAEERSFLHSDERPNSGYGNGRKVVEIRDVVTEDSPLGSIAIGGDLSLLGDGSATATFGNYGELVVTGATTNASTFSGRVTNSSNEHFARKEIVYIPWFWDRVRVCSRRAILGICVSHRWEDRDRPAKGRGLYAITSLFDPEKPDSSLELGSGLASFSTSSLSLSGLSRFENREALVEVSDSTTIETDMYRDFSGTFNTGAFALEAPDQLMETLVLEDAYKVGLDFDEDLSLLAEYLSEGVKKNIFNAKIDAYSNLRSTLRTRISSLSLSLGASSSAKKGLRIRGAVLESATSISLDARGSTCVDSASEASACINLDVASYNGKLTYATSSAETFPLLFTLPFLSTEKSSYRGEFTNLRALRTNLKSEEDLVLDGNPVITASTITTTAAGGAGNFLVNVDEKYQENIFREHYTAIEHFFSSSSTLLSSRKHAKDLYSYTNFPLLTELSTNDVTFSSNDPTALARVSLHGSVYELSGTFRSGDGSPVLSSADGISRGNDLFLYTLSDASESEGSVKGLESFSYKSLGFRSEEGLKDYENFRDKAFGLKPKEALELCKTHQLSCSFSDARDSDAELSLFSFSSEETRNFDFSWEGDPGFSEFKAQNWYLYANEIELLGIRQEIENTRILSGSKILEDIVYEYSHEENIQQSIKGEFTLLSVIGALTSFTLKKEEKDTVLLSYFLGAKVNYLRRVTSSRTISDKLSTNIAQLSGIEFLESYDGIGQEIYTPEYLTSFNVAESVLGEDDVKKGLSISSAENSLLYTEDKVDFSTNVFGVSRGSPFAILGAVGSIASSVLTLNLKNFADPFTDIWHSLVSWHLDPFLGLDGRLGDFRSSNRVSAARETRTETNPRLFSIGLNPEKKAEKTSLLSSGDLSETSRIDIRGRGADVVLRGVQFDAIGSGISIEPSEGDLKIFSVAKTDQSSSLAFRASGDFRASLQIEATGRGIGEFVGDLVSYFLYPITFLLNFDVSKSPTEGEDSEKDESTVSFFNLSSTSIMNTRPTTIDLEFTDSRDQKAIFSHLRTTGSTADIILSALSPDATAASPLTLTPPETQAHILYLEGLRLDAVDADIALSAEGFAYLGDSPTDANGELAIGEGGVFVRSASDTSSRIETTLSGEADFSLLANQSIANQDAFSVALSLGLSASLQSKLAYRTQHRNNVFSADNGTLSISSSEASIFLHGLSATAAKLDLAAKDFVDIRSVYNEEYRLQIAPSSLAEHNFQLLLDISPNIVEQILSENKELSSSVLDLILSLQLGLSIQYDKYYVLDSLGKEGQPFYVSEFDFEETSLIARDQLRIILDTDYLARSHPRDGYLVNEGAHLGVSSNTLAGVAAPLFCPGAGAAKNLCIDTFLYSPGNMKPHGFSAKIDFNFLIERVEGDRNSLRNGFYLNIDLSSSADYEASVYDDSRGRADILFNGQSLDSYQTAKGVGGNMVDFFLTSGADILSSDGTPLLGAYVHERAFNLLDVSSSALSSGKSTIPLPFLIACANPAILAGLGYANHQDCAAQYSRQLREIVFSPIIPVYLTLPTDNPDETERTIVVDSEHQAFLTGIILENIERIGLQTSYTFSSCPLEDTTCLLNPPDISNIKGVAATIEDDPIYFLYQLFDEVAFVSAVTKNMPFNIFDLISFDGQIVDNNLRPGDTPFYSERDVILGILQYSLSSLLKTDSDAEEDTE